MATRRYGSYSIEISNREKVFFPDCGITKGEIVDYYARVAETMLLPYVRGRIVTMRRFPNDITGRAFTRRKFRITFRNGSKESRWKRKTGKLVQLVIENAATLVYLANQACITPHVWLSRAVRRDRPIERPLIRRVVELHLPVEKGLAFSRTTRKLESWPPAG